MPDSYQGKFDEADRLCLRAIDIHEKALGPDHPHLGAPLNNRAMLLMAQVRVRFPQVSHIYFSTTRAGGIMNSYDSVLLDAVASPWQGRVGKVNAA